MKNFIAIFLFLGILSGGCTKDKNLITDSGSVNLKNDTLSTAALLQWRSEYATDGCGFIIEIDETEYKASNEDLLGETFKATYDPIPVGVTYIDLNKKQSYNCGDLPFLLEYDVIEILSIAKL